MGVLSRLLFQFTCSPFFCSDLFWFVVFFSFLTWRPIIHVADDSYFSNRELGNALLLTFSAFERVSHTTIRSKFHHPSPSHPKSKHELTKLVSLDSVIFIHTMSPAVRGKDSNALRHSGCQRGLIILSRVSPMLMW